jgi:hypothetical protein
MFVELVEGKRNNIIVKKRGSQKCNENGNEFIQDGKDIDYQNWKRSRQRSKVEDNFNN